VSGREQGISAAGVGSGKSINKHARHRRARGAGSGLHFMWKCGWMGKPPLPAKVKLGMGRGKVGSFQGLPCTFHSNKPSGLHSTGNWRGDASFNIKFALSVSLGKSRTEHPSSVPFGYFHRYPGSGFLFLFPSGYPRPVPTYTRAGSSLTCVDFQRAGAGNVCSAKESFSFGSRSNERWPDQREQRLQRTRTRARGDESELFIFYFYLFIHQQFW
jgi:hypothetical protein